MVSFAAVALLGFFLGMRHATDPDHVVAVTTIVSRERRLGRAAAVGALWGLGHTLTIVAVGGAIVLFGVVIPQRVGLSMELSVAGMLIVLGAANLASASRAAARLSASPPRLHVGERSTHVHALEPVSREPGWLDRAFGGLSPFQLVRPVAVGIVHGLAGSAAVALLVLATIRDPRWAIGYLLVFGLGTIAGMMLVTAGIGLPFTMTARRFSKWNRGLRLVSGAASLALGLFLVYRIGWVDGLFTSAPHWTPR